MRAARFLKRFSTTQVVMSSPRITKEARASWLRLYETVDRIDRLSPWPWMEPASCFGVAVPDMEEPCFVLFGEPGREMRAIRILLGWKAFYEMMTRLADPAKQGVAWLLEIRMIEVLCAPEPLLFQHERDFLRAIRREPDGKGEWTIFRSIVPGYHPWLPDAKERKLLEDVLYQAFGMALRVEADPGMLRSRFPREILIRTSDGKGGWRDVWSRVKELSGEEIEVRIESRRLQALAAKPTCPVTLQVDLLFTPFSIQPGRERPQTAYVLLAVDAQSGLIHCGELFQAIGGIAAMWSEIPDRLIALFERLGGCPDAIEVRGDRMANLMRPLTEFLPFKLVRREHLKMLDEARVGLSAYLRNGEEEA